MLHRIFLYTIFIGCGILGYALLAFGTTSRASQVLGLPLLGLLAVAVAKLALCVRGRTPRAYGSALLGALALVVLAEGYGVMRLARGVSTGPVSDADFFSLRDAVQEFVKQQAWETLVRHVESAGTISDPLVLSDAGFAYEQLGRTSDAVASYTKAIMLHPDLPGPHYELARLYESTGELVKAGREYERVLELNDALPDVHLAYGGLLVKLGNRRAALQHIETAMRVYPDGKASQIEAQQLLAAVSKEGRP